MKYIKVSPGNLKVTATTLLDMAAVRRYFDLFRTKANVEPVVLVQEPGISSLLLADGNHTSFGGYLSGKTEIDGLLLETDDDVRTVNLGPTKEFKTLKELLDYCLRCHESSKEIGCEYICDYASLQRPEWPIN